MPVWDANQYLKFADERTQPALDLIHRIGVESPRRIIDLGCGPGNSTAALRRRWPEAEVAGLDNSPEMIEKARRDAPEATWIEADVATWEAVRPFDVVFSNAVLQWVPGHEQVFPRLLKQVAPGGALAVQMPYHYESRLQRHMLEVSRDPAWADRTAAAREALIRLPPGFYYDLLAPLASRLDLWITEYQHVLDGPESIVEWFRGTGMRPYLEALDSNEERARFEAMLLERYREAYPRQKDGRVLFPFRRLFIVAYP